MGILDDNTLNETNDLVLTRGRLLRIQGIQDISRIATWKEEDTGIELGGYVTGKIHCGGITDRIEEIFSLPEQGEGHGDGEVERERKSGTVAVGTKAV